MTPLADMNSLFWISTVHNVGDYAGFILGCLSLAAIAILILERRRVERRLKQLLEQERLLGTVSQRIRQSLKLEEIFQTTVAEVLTLLNAERVYIAYCPTDTDTKLVAESVSSGYASVLEYPPSRRLLKKMKEELSNGKVKTIANIAQVKETPEFKAYCERLSIQAAIIIPLELQEKLIGVLVVHQCRSPRHWHSNEVALLKQLSTQISVAIQQAQLYQQVQDLNTGLTHQVEERTSQLEEQIGEVENLSNIKLVCLQAVAHDLRTTTMGMLMILNTLQQSSGEIVSLSRTMLERMIESSDRTLTLINSVSEELDGEPLPIPLQYQPLPLQEILTPVFLKHQNQLLKNQVKLNNLIGEQFPRISADPTQVGKVIEQLLLNAIKHNPPGVKIDLDATVERGMMRFAVTDDGVGMSQKQSKSLFNLYVRNLHNPRLTGIGLGSYLCRQIIQAHGGEIGVSSQPEAGTTVWFTLPLAASEICQK